MGGKTGTAQKGDRDDKKYVVSFIGFAPVENPEVLVYVVIDEANVPLDQQSSALATELAKEIFTEILPYLNVFQDEEIEEGENPDNPQGEFLSSLSPFWAVPVLPPMEYPSTLALLPVPSDTVL